MLLQETTRADLPLYSGRLCTSYFFSARARDAIASTHVCHRARGVLLGTPSIIFVRIIWRLPLRTFHFPACLSRK